MWRAEIQAPHSQQINCHDTITNGYILAKQCILQKHDTQLRHISQYHLTPPLYTPSTKCAAAVQMCDVSGL